MVSRVTLPDARIPIGHAVVNGQPVDVAIDIEWMRAFVDLLTRGGGTSAPSTPDILTLVNRMSGAGGREGDQGDPGNPGPPGAQGIQGVAGATGFPIPGQDGEDGANTVILVPSSVTASQVSALGYWSPLTNGDPVTPELIFDSNGDTVAVWTNL